MIVEARTRPACGGSLKAYATVSLREEASEGIVLQNFRVVERAERTEVVFPTAMVGEGRLPLVMVKDKALRSRIIEAILSAYQAMR